MKESEELIKSTPLNLNLVELNLLTRFLHEEALKKHADIVRIKSDLRSIDSLRNRVSTAIVLLEREK